MKTLKNIIISTVASILISFSTLATETVDYKALNGMGIKLNKELFDKYQYQYASFLKNLNSCSEFNNYFYNPAHGTKTNLDIIGIRKNHCVVKFEIENAQIYKCMFNRKQLDNLVSYRTDYLNSVEYVEGFSPQELKIYNKKNCIIENTSSNNKLSKKELDEIASQQPSIQFLINSMSKEK